MPFRLKRSRPANSRVKDSTPPTSSRSEGSDFSDSSDPPRFSKKRRSSRLAKMGIALSRHHHPPALVKVAPPAPVSPDPLVMLTEALLKDAKELQANGVHDDKDTKRKITMKAKKIFQEVAGADDIVGSYAVAMGEIGATYIFMHWKLFDKIPDEGSVSFKELAEAIDAEESLIARIGGMLVSVGRLSYAGQGRVCHSKTSRMFRSNQHAGNLFRVMFEHGLRGYTHWPEYFTTYGPKEPTHVTHNPFTYGWGHPEMTVWDVVAIDEERATVFASGMKSLNTISGKHNGPSSIYDFGWLGAEAKTGSDKARALLVDVGGSHGHTLKHILETVPALPAERCVLQDLPDVVDQAIREDEPALRGVKKMGHDFNKEQPVKGALTYMLRRVLHDYGDDACIKILSNLAAALDPAEPRARVLIMDQIVSDPPTPRNAAADMVMLNIGGKERTPADFTKIASESGLKVVKIHRIEGTEVGVVECAKA